MPMLLTGFFRNVILLIFVFSISYLNAHTEMLEGKYYSHNELVIHTADNVTIWGSLFDSENDRVIIYCHQLLGSQSGEEVQQLLEAFIDEYDLITFNFRGHKSSGWESTTGGDEVLDLRAVISFAVREGYGKIVVLGSGMGGSVAIRTAGIFRNIDALIVVSPSGFSPEVQPFFIKIATDITLNTDYGRVALRILTNTRLGTRYTAGYPIDIIADVSPIPLLIVQSENDRFIDLNKLRNAFSHALEPKKLIEVPGRLHANTLLVKSTLVEIRNWLKDVFSEHKCKDNFLLEEGIFNSTPDSIQIVLTGDLPIPETLIIRDYFERLNRHAGISNSTKINSKSILYNLEDVFSFYGYNITSLAVSDLVSPCKIQISIPKIQSISIEGNKYVTDSYIQRLLKIDGDYYNSYEIDTAIRRLSSEQSIRTVTSNIKKREDGNIDLHLTVFEQRPYRLLLSTKFTDIDKFFGIGFTWNEFNPSGIQYGGKAMVGMFDHNLLTSFNVAKDVWGNSIRLNGEYFDTIKSRDDLDYVYTRQEVHETGGEAAASYKMTSTLNVSLGLFGKKFKSPEVNSKFPVQNGTAIGDFLKLDVKGKLPPQDSPRFNWRHTFYYQNSGFGGMGNFNYNTFQLNSQGELNLWRRHLSVSTFHYGWLSGEAPPQEHFSLGGMTTLPGYPDDSFVNTRMMRASQAIYLDASNWVAETSLLEPLRIIFAFNAGTVWGHNEKFETSDLKMDIGFELDYKKVLRLGIAAPVGPQRLKSPRVYIGWGTHVF